MSAPDSSPQYFSNTALALDEIMNRLGKNVRLATPLGLGKPNLLLNLIYEKVKKEPGHHLTIFSALSLNPPVAPPGLGQRFLGPFLRRHWGENYPTLKYSVESESAKNSFPKNVDVHEFYFMAGAALKSPLLQRNYQSINYTYVTRAILQSDVRVLVQLIAKKVTPEGVRYSLSCNPDLTLDLIDLYKKKSKSLLFVGAVHPDLPFMGGEAELDEKQFDLIIDDPESQHELFALPRMPISASDHAIGFHTSQLIADDGTLQVGIGSLSDAVVHSLIMRQKKSDVYLKLFNLSWNEKAIPPQGGIEHKPFEMGLYGLSEMITDGFMHLRRAGILKRHVVDERTGSKTYLHGAFFLGSKEFYSWLRSLQGEEYSGVRMSRISKINDLYDPNEVLLRAQRKNARFLNTCMQVTLLGGAASETLEDGRVVSGVGGQYNFVSMAHELPDARSVLMLRSTRVQNGKRISNLVWTHGHLTIPRHLRDTVVTEYGIADLRNTTDEQSIIALLNIADSEFQPSLMAIAKKNGKLALDYQIPKWASNNTPEKIETFIKQGKALGCFGPFPFGSDFTAEEENLAIALGSLEAATSGAKWRSLKNTLRLLALSFSIDSKRFEPELERMGLTHAKSFKDKLMRRLLLSTLHPLSRTSLPRN